MDASIAEPLRLADRAARLGTETAFEVLARVNELKAQGRDIISFGIGEPDFETPDNIKEAARAALTANKTHYVPSAGIPELREAAARYIATSRGLDVGPQNIVVTPGAKPVLFSALMALVNPGDEVIYPSPGFPIYESLIEWSGAAAVPIRLQEDRQWRFDTDELAALVTDKTRLIILNSPHNPTGGVLTEADMAAIADLARSRDIWILTDEVYSNIVFDGEFVSITRQPGMMDRTIIVEGFSKTYAMTGWRLGYAVCRADLAVHLARIETNVHSCTSAPVQWAGVEALTGPQEAPALMAESFRRRADLITSLLNDIEGVKCQKPGGAFYVMANVSGACQRLELPSAKEFCDKLLLEAGVAILPRTCFGRRLPGEEEYVRFSFATSEELIRAGVQRLKEFVEG